MNFQTVKVRYQNTALPSSNDSFYYFQTLIDLYMTTEQMEDMEWYEDAGWLPDDRDAKLDELAPFNANEGLTQRFSKYTKNKSVTLRAPLRVNGVTDLKPNVLIPPNVAIEMTFEMADSEFYLCSNSDDKYIFRIEDIYLQAS